MRISDWSSDVCSSDLASDDPHEQAMPFPNMGNNPLIPILGSCRNWHQSGFPSGARQGTPSPWLAQTCPQPPPCALRAGNRLLHLLIPNLDLAARTSFVEGRRVSEGGVIGGRRI